MSFEGMSKDFSVFGALQPSIQGCLDMNMQVTQRLDNVSIYTMVGKDFHNKSGMRKNLYRLFAQLRHRRERERAKHQRQVSRPSEARGRVTRNQRQQRSGQSAINADHQKSVLQERKGWIHRSRRRRRGGADQEINHPKGQVRAPAHPCRVIESVAPESFRTGQGRAFSMIACIIKRR